MSKNSHLQKQKLVMALVSAEMQFQTFQCPSDLQKSHEPFLHIQNVCRLKIWGGGNEIRVAMLVSAYSRHHPASSPYG